MKVLLVISSLHHGGAERVMSIMANYWAEKGVDVTLLTFFPEEADCYVLHPDVKRVVLHQAKPSKSMLEGAFNNIQRIRRLREAIIHSQPESIISFLVSTNVLVLLASLGLKIPIIISERNDPRKNPTGRVRNFLRKILYPYAKMIVLQTESVAQWVIHSIPKTNTVVIPNPVRLPHNKAWSDKPKNVKLIVVGGRLEHVKGFDLMIQAFSECVKKYSEWQLLIMGEGCLRGELEAQVHQHGLEQKIIFLGWVKNTDSILQASDMFVLSSRTEGFPNVLIEAMACGLPVVSFDCQSGPADIIEDGVNGMLVPDGHVDKLAIVMQQLMLDNKLASDLGREAKKITQTLSLDSVMGQWTALLSDK